MVVFKMTSEKKISVFKVNKKDIRKIAIDVALLSL